jgi:hypothetical protein
VAVAVTVAAPTATPCRLNGALVAPAAIVTPTAPLPPVPGIAPGATSSRVASLLVSVTASPPAGAGWLVVTVQQAATSNPAPSRVVVPTLTVSVGVADVTTTVWLAPGPAMKPGIAAVTVVVPPAAIGRKATPPAETVLRDS